MNHNEFKNKINQIPDYQNEGERRSGGILGVYVVFAKWKNEDEYIFVRAYETRKGVVYMLSTIPEEVYLQQDYRILYLRGNSENYVEELLIVESTNDDAT